MVQALSTLQCLQTSKVSSFQFLVRRQQSCTAIQLDDRLYTELDRPFEKALCSSDVVLVAAKAICPPSSEAHHSSEYRLATKLRERRRAASPGRALQAAKPVLAPKSESG